MRWTEKRLKRRAAEKRYSTFTYYPRKDDHIPRLFRLFSAYSGDIIFSTVKSEPSGREYIVARIPQPASDGAIAVKAALDMSLQPAFASMTLTEIVKSTLGCRG